MQTANTDFSTLRGMYSCPSTANSTVKADAISLLDPEPHHLRMSARAVSLAPKAVDTWRSLVPWSIRKCVDAAINTPVHTDTDPLSELILYATSRPLLGVLSTGTGSPDLLTLHDRFCHKVIGGDESMERRREVNELIERLRDRMDFSLWDQSAQGDLEEGEV